MAEKSTKKTNSKEKGTSKRNSSKTAKKTSKKSASKKNTKKTNSIKKTSKKTNQKSNSFVRRNAWTLGIIAIFLVALALVLFPVFGGDGIITGNQVAGSGGGGAGGPDQIENKVTVGGKEYSVRGTDTDITRLIFFVMVILLIWSAMRYMGLPPQRFLQWVFAVMIGYLSVAYITPDEIFAVLSTYSALGLTIMSAVPFTIMMLFSSAILSPLTIRNELDAEGREVTQQVTDTGQLSIGKVILVQILWIFFSLFLIYKAIFNVIVPYFQGNLSLEGLTVGMIVFIVSLLGSVLVTLWNKSFRSWIMGIGKEIKDWQSAFKTQDEVQQSQQDQQIRGARAEERRRNGL